MASKRSSSMRKLLLALFVAYAVADMQARPPAGSSSSSSSSSSTGPLQVAGQVISGPLNAPEPVGLRKQEAAVKDLGTYTTRGVTFECSGSQCGATLYLPKPSKTSSSSSLPPVIVAAHGLGGERIWLGKFASVFAQNGFAVLTFDYRHWGSSDGLPRQWISIAKQHQDWFAAIKHVQTKMGSLVDAKRLSLWGTSFAGGHVIVVSSKLPGQIKAVISNVPHLDGQKATQANAAMRGARGNALVAMAALADLASDNRGGGQPVYIPLAGKIGSTAIMQLTDHDLAVYSAAHTETESQWRNLTRARFATEQTFSQYSPINSVDKVQAPLLIIAGKKDNLCPFVSAVAAAAKAPKGHLVSFDVGHFDPYVQPTLGQSLQKQLEFLKEHAV